MSEQQLREQLYASFKHRAILYWLIFDELREELGQDKATELLKRAVYRRGEQVGQKFAPFGPDDLQGLREAFLGGIPDEGRMFDPEVIRCDESALDIVFHRCPLKEAWQEAGLSNEDGTLMCEIAAEIDCGTFAAAGFDFTAATWKPPSQDCCHLHIRPGGTT